MKKVTALVICCLAIASIFAQHELSGTFTNSTNEKAVQFATIELKSSFRYTATTNVNGKFKINNIQTGTYTITISHPEFDPKSFPFTISENQSLNIALSPKSAPSDVRILPIIRELDEFVLKGTRADENTPVTYSTVTKEDIEAKNLGQDLPTILEHTPSIITTSDAGAGIGYTSMRLRGSDFSRINMTINGVPYNDSESQGIFLVNLPDFASSIEDIQVQRGVGTSTNGSGAFGGSINIKTKKLNQKPFAELSNSIGSYNTVKNTISGGTGLINNKWAFEGRLSRIVSDGFIDRASVELESYYLSAGYQNDNTLIRLVNFSGEEVTYQAWNGTPEARVTGNKNALETHYANNIGSLYNTFADSVNLFSSDRSYNYYTYQNEVDNYQQDHYQLLLTQQLSGVHLNAALHYTKGQGYFEQFKYKDDLADYDINNITIGGDTITQSNIVRRRWLDNDFYGLTLDANHDVNSELSLTAGSAWNQYAGKHFGEVIWAEYAGNRDINHRYYDNDAQKTDYTLFVKANYRVNDQIDLFGDLQYRNVGYNFLGFSESGNSAIQNVVHDFVNPKLGITYAYDNYNTLYGSFAMANREPTRDDYTNTSTLSRPLPEQLVDIEMGWKHKKDALTLNANVYIMDYKNQLVLTGKLNDVGEFTRQNVEQSSRTGIEAIANYIVNEQWQVGGNLTLSSNKIADFDNYVFNYDTGLEEVQRFKSTDISFSPNVIGAAKVQFKPMNNLSVALLTKYVGPQYLDNTGSTDKRLDGYMVNDILASYTLKQKIFEEISLQMKLNNLFSVNYSASGYTYSYITGGQTITENFLYPQANINALIGLTLKF